MTDSTGTLLDALSVALSDVAALIADPEVLHALTSHLTAREVMVIARLFQAAGQDDAYRWVVEGIIHGDEEVRAVATPDVAGPGSVRVEYFNEFVDRGTADAPLDVREFENGGLHSALRELRLEVDTEDWSAIKPPGCIVLASARRI
ncbi:hypothetical protein [Dietzia psychralcaliphila]|jgi:hypothetical protein|uniref:hypothetical protein n=1 Tax=Dietzia psychralcaliphila TaxID=139021 RepID=UPI001C1E0930|nr:hypothetical protein [Dietzia psychralcaliphila]